jgi:TRAP-type C4-dicarboxylate transport system permease small subunit
VKRLRRAAQQKMMERLFDGLMRAIERSLALAFLFAVCFNFANVIGRYGFGRTVLGADEIQTYIIVVMTFLGAAVVTWRRRHISMDLVASALPAAMRTAFLVLEAVVLAAIAGFVAWQSWLVTRAMFDMGRLSDAAGIPMWIVHVLVLLGFALVCLIALWQAIALVHPAKR